MRLETIQKRIKALRQENRIREAQALSRRLARLEANRDYTVARMRCQY